MNAPEMRRAPGGGLEAGLSGRKIATENSPIRANGQAVVTIVKVSPATRPVSRHDWIGVDRAIAPPRLIAILFGVNPSTVRRWRSGKHRPRPRHWRPLMALRGMVYATARRAGR